MGFNVHNSIMTTIDMTDDENVLELYHRISENEQELDNILTINDGEINIEDFDLQLIEKLEWLPTQNGEFTFQIEENEYIVKIEKAAPKSINKHLDTWYGVTSDNNTIKDLVGNNNANLDGSAEISFDENWFEDYKIDLSEAGDNSIYKSKNTISTSNNEFSYCCWCEIKSDDRGYTIILSDEPDANENRDVGIRADNGFIEHYARDSSDSARVDGSISIDKNERIFVAGSYDGSNYQIGAWNENEKLGFNTGSSSRNPSFSSNITIMGGTEGDLDNGLEGFVDGMGISVDKILNEKDFEEIWNDTK